MRINSNGNVFIGDTSIKTVNNKSVLNIPNIPTSSDGLSPGDVYSDAGTLKIV
jgi:hypothetical protein